MRKNLKAGSNGAGGSGGGSSYHHVGANSNYHHGQQQQAQLRPHFHQHHHQQPDHQQPQHHQHQHSVSSPNGQHYPSMAGVMANSGQHGSIEQMQSPATAPNEHGDVMFHSDGVGTGFGGLSRDSGHHTPSLVPHPSSMSPGQQQLAGVADHSYQTHAHGNHSADYQQHHGNIYSRQTNDHHHHQQAQQQQQHSSHNPAHPSAGPPGAPPPAPHQQQQPPPPPPQGQPPHQHQGAQPQSMHHAQHQHHHHPSHSIQPHHGQHPHPPHHHHHYSRSQVHGHNGAPGPLGYHSNSGNHHGPIGNMASQSTVMMVYGLQPDRINCDRLFNLFCLYGNVAKIKFLRTKEGCAMVQMGDILAIDRCINSLNKMTLFGNELQISYSKQPFLHDVIQPFILPDGSPSFMDFTGNKNNRFKNPEVASKNRISSPSQVLHFFNAPLGTTEDDLVHLFKQVSGLEPLSIKIFTPKTENSKSLSGLATFKTPAEASEALVVCNHLSMPKTGAPHPYILRLCFSPPTYARSHQQQHQQPQIQHQQTQQQSNSSSPQPQQEQVLQQQQQTSDPSQSQQQSMQTLT